MAIQPTAQPNSVTVSLTDMANALRVLSMDAVQAAASGHPGAPMGMADMAVALWGQHFKHNPDNPMWPDRDRFVLSNGHASMLLYAVLHVTGYDLPMDEIKNFRQLGSQTPGHPERHIEALGIETTTGPLGQGLANAVGMALAEKLLAAEFNREGCEVVDHRTYTFVGDGCLMEGISQEAISLAGVWKLNKLIALYDANDISIDGQLAPWFADNTAQRFVASGWHVLGPVDGHDALQVASAIATAQQSADRPTLIICKTTIGYGSPNRAGTAKSHGEPLGADEVALTRQKLGWTDPPFVISDALYAAWNAKDAGRQAEQSWVNRLADYQKAYPALAQELSRRYRGDLPSHFDPLAAKALFAAHARAESVASRRASQMALEQLTAELPELLGGSADLSGSNLTQTPSTPALRFSPEGASNGGRHINYGVREFGMAAIMNGIALHGGFVPYGGTFLTFCDYSRNALRMAALMQLRVVHVFTHDSIGVGEDGPTHQPIEHAASLRLIPHLDVWRPCDAAETTVAWTVALQQNRNRPTALLLSRQALSYCPKDALDNIGKGGYVLAGPDRVGLSGPARAILIATGSEVQLALQAQSLLASKHIAVCVVSMPSTTTFDRQDDVYKSQVLPSGVPRIAVEMGVKDGWWKYGCAAVVGIDSFGESAPASVLFAHFGFTPECVADTVCQVLQTTR